MRELHFLKTCVSPRRESHFGATEGTDKAKMDLCWDQVGLCWAWLGPMLAYVGPCWTQGGLCWARLGPCWVNFRSWAPFFASWALLGHFVTDFGSSSLFWGRLGPCRVRFWQVWGRTGEGFGSLGASFSMFFPTFAVGLRKSLDLYKTLAGAVKIKVCA